MTTARGALVLLAAVVAIVVASAGPSVGYGYVQDGLHVAARNAVVERGDPAEIVTSHYWAGTSLRDRSLYRPTSVASFSIERAWTGGPASAAVSHAVNLALHALVACLLAAYVLRIGGGKVAATTAALLFAAHPVTQQTVVNVAGRPDLLAAALSLAALLALSYADGWRGGKAPSPGRRRAAAWGGGALVLLALGAKEVAIATVLLAALQEAWFRTPRAWGRRSWWLARAGALLPVAAATLVYVGFRTVAIEAFPGLQEVGWIDNVLVDLDGTERVATTLAFAGRYVGLALWPARLAGDWTGGAIPVERGLVSTWPLVGVAAAVGAVALLSAPWWRRRSSRDGEIRAPALAMATALAVVPYLVVGNVLVPNRAGFALRLLYLPALGACALAGLGTATLLRGLDRRSGRRATLAARVALGVVVVAATVHAREENRFWRDDESFLVHNLEVRPTALRSRFTLAGIRMDQGRLDEAIRHYETVLEREPRHSWSWTYAALLYLRRGEPGRAEAAIRRGVLLLPDDSENRMWLGSILASRGAYAEAERELRRALVLAPANVPAAVGLAEVLERQGRYDEAARWYRRCIDRGVPGLEERLRAVEERTRQPGRR